MPNGPNLILGAAWNLSVPDVRVFVESLRRHFRGDVTLLITSRASAPLAKYLMSHGITPIIFDCPYWMV
jgi:hypothetical protein